MKKKIFIFLILSLILVTGCTKENTAKVEDVKSSTTIKVLEDDTTTTRENKKTKKSNTTKKTKKNKTTTKKKCYYDRYSVKKNEKLYIGNITQFVSLFNSGYNIRGEGGECTEVYSSSNSTVAEINSTGYITPLKNGTTYISACLVDKNNSSKEYDCINNIKLVVYGEETTTKKVFTTAKRTTTKKNNINKSNVNKSDNNCNTTTYNNTYNTYNNNKRTFKG